MRALPIVVLVSACAAPAASDRQQRVIDTLADDNYAWARRDPALIALKMKKLQREPYAWLRGTAALYWRDLTEPGGERTVTAFADPASSRVLLVGDPHPENIGTFRAADGTMLADWNDLDAAGFGPFTADVRRLAIGMIVAADTDDEDLEDELARRVASAYSAQIAALAAGMEATPVGMGANPLLDKELTKAKTRGDTLFAVDELAPETDGVRYVAFGDLEAIGADGVYEDTVQPVGAEAAAWLDAAVAKWDPSAVVKLRARRIGSGVSSYAALRYNVILEGPTAANDDDQIIELKEERDGLILHGVPMLQFAPWASPAARTVDAQRRLQRRPDEDVRLGAADLGGLSLKIRDREAYQRGLDHLDLAELAAGSPSKQAQLLQLADVLATLLADAHGAARTLDGEVGWTVIAPVLAGREAAFVEEMRASARAGADQVVADHAAFANVDLAAMVLP